MRIQDSEIFLTLDPESGIRNPGSGMKKNSYPGSRTKFWIRSSGPWSAHFAPLNNCHRRSLEIPHVGTYCAPEYLLPL